MKKLFILILLSGCCTLNEGYVRQDRKYFDTMTPRVLEMIDDTEIYDEDQKQDLRDRLHGNNTRISAAEALLKEAKE